MLTVEVKNAGGWIEMWGAWKPEHVVQEPLRAGMQRAARRLAEYPPKRPQQTYKRTGGLGREWMGAKIVIQGMDARMSNQKPYAKWVQGATTQAWFHKNRWTTDQQAIDAEMPQILRDIDAAIEESLNNV